MSTRRDGHRQWTQAARSDPDYRAHENELYRTRYRRRTALQRQLSRSLSSLSSLSSSPSPHQSQPPLQTPWWILLRQHPPSPIVPPTWNRRCQHCNAWLLSTESNSFCCGNGTRRLPPLHPLPSRMHALLNDATRLRHIIEYCRVVNNFFSFAGIGVSGGFQHFHSGAGAGPPAVAITGRTYHLLRDTEYEDHSIHWFLYDEKMRRHKAQEFGVYSSVIQAITDDLHTVNPYVHHLRQFRPRSRRKRQLEIRDFSANGDFAAVMHASNSTDINPRSIVVRRRGHREPQFLNILSRHYEPLHYVLFFPSGEIGWGISIVDGVPNLSQIDWYRSRLLADDEDRFSIFGRLCCEYLVDMYSRTEEQRLTYIARERKRHTDELRNQQEGQEEEEEFDDSIKLPASFVGSRAWTSDQTADAMALGRSFGKPTFFCTMTFNPDWPEVRARLRPGQSATDIPVIVARVFKCRLEKVLHVLRTRFGEKKYLIKVIEFQKRGFPHAHIIIKVHPEIPFDQLDSIISAELPRDNPARREKVHRYMMHSPDHLTRAGSRCNRDGQCIYGFPHPLQATTTVDEYGRVHWRRREEEDRWVVPYCSVLLDFADCHFHFDVVYTAKVFSYLYKYLYKGPDHALFAVNDVEDGAPPLQPINEVDDYQKARYLSAPEAAWRILGFEITRKEPSVESLPVHLPGKNTPQFHRAGARSTASLLDHYFLRPGHLQDLRYEQYYEQYILYPLQLQHLLRAHEFMEQPKAGVVPKMVSRRVKTDHITRINTVPIRSGEVFYLRSLLQHKPASSFLDLRTINGHVFDTFHQAASDLGLFDNDREGFLALQEAVDCHRTPSQLRFLFAQIILEGYPATILWDEFKQRLSIDNILQLGDEANGYRRTLQRIDDILSQSRRHLEDFGIQLPERRSIEIVNEERFLTSNHAALEAERDNMCTMLNEEQRRIFDAICDGIEAREHSMFFVEGRPGRGKTFMVNALASTLRAAGHIILIVGSSALCATAYKRGRTAHYMFGIPVTEDCTDLHSTIHPFSARADLIRNATAIIWDELPMANKAAWECVDELCRRIMNKPNKPFGGIPVIGLGDFRQVAPVVSGAGEFASLAASVKSSPLWSLMQIFTLATPVRSIGDPTYTNFVDTVGEDCSGVRQSLRLIRHITNINDAIEFLFPPHILDDPTTCLQRAFLSPRNIFVDEFNEMILDALPGDYESYFSSDSLKEAEQVPADAPEQTPDYLAMLTHPNTPPHRLDLKIGAVCAIQRNLSVEKGLVRNARVCITALHRRFIEVQIPETEERHCLPRITFTFNPPGSSWTVNRKQFPLRAAYATTFNGSQGLTLQKAVLDLRTDSFAHGQLYTALSRVRGRRHIQALFREQEEETTANVVYRRLLL